MVETTVPQETWQISLPHPGTTYPSQYIWSTSLAPCGRWTSDTWLRLSNYRFGRQCAVENLANSLQLPRTALAAVCLILLLLSAFDRCATGVSVGRPLQHSEQSKSST